MDNDAFHDNEPVEQPIEDYIDLHFFRASEAADVVREYLLAAHEKGFRSVRIIHGKGMSKLKNRIESVLAKHPLVSEFSTAPPHLGGWGATIAELKDSEV